MIRTIRGMAAAAVLALAVGCTDSTGPLIAPGQRSITDDVARDANETTALDLEQVALDEAFAALTPVFPRTPACSYSSVVERFLCPTVVTAQGITIQRSFAVFGRGSAQTAYDPVTTDSVNFQVYRTGSIGGPTRTVWLNQSRNTTISGLAGAETERIWNGTGTRADSMLTTENGVTRLVRIGSVDRISGLRFAVPRSTNPFPLRGTITHDVTVTTVTSNANGAQSRTATRHVEITFDGTRTAQMRIGTQLCTLDLQTRAVSCTR
ncbi:MAG TPA: hypothetical protein VHM67_06780 [Gemmatimonadaceae bacterium]|nr:hypothetical protein [Gemmatimonadaceae bacterium]